MAKLLQAYTSRITVTITGEHGTGDIELRSESNLPGILSCERTLNYDESFKISRVELVVRNENPITFVLAPELLTCRITTLYNICELVRPDSQYATAPKLLTVNATIKHIHSRLFSVEMSDSDVKLLEC